LHERVTHQALVVVATARECPVLLDELLFPGDGVDEVDVAVLLLRGVGAGTLLLGTLGLLALHDVADSNRL
jgi:hypothetical protein